jgi:cell division protein FtsB
MKSAPQTGAASAEQEIKKGIGTGGDERKRTGGAASGIKAAPKPLIQPKLWVALFCVIVAIMAGSLFRVTRLYQATMAQADSLKAELVLEEAEKTRLTSERDYMTTSAYIEREARIEYGYIYPSDIRFVAALEPLDDELDGLDDLYEAGEDWDGEEFGQAVEVVASGE